MPRQARKKSQTGIYHVMLRGINQQQIFQDTEDYEKFLQLLIYCKTLSDFKIFAYCLMGNHVHLLIQETNETIELIMKRIETRFVYWYNIKYKRVGHLFQDRYKSEAVENDEYFLTVLRYIHQNPVKSGICENPQDYKYSSYNEYLNNSYIVDSDFVFEIAEKDVFIEFCNQNSTDKCMDVEDKIKVKVTEEQAREIIMKYSGCNNISQFQNLSKSAKEEYIKKFHESGISIRQISRLCGESKGLVEKNLK